MIRIYSQYRHCYVVLQGRTVLLPRTAVTKLGPRDRYEVLAFPSADVAEIAAQRIVQYLEDLLLGDPGVIVTRG